MSTVVRLMARASTTMSSGFFALVLDADRAGCPPVVNSVREVPDLGEALPGAASDGRDAGRVGA